MHGTFFRDFQGLPWFQELVRILLEAFAKNTDISCTGLLIHILECSSQGIMQKR